LRPDEEDPMAQTAGTIEPGVREVLVNGSAMAAFMGGGIGAFVLGLVVFLNETGAVSLPVLYAPAGGLSTRVALGVVLWLVAWGILHSRWRNREIVPGPVYKTTTILIVLGIIATFPPFLGLF
jgi:hypothetical protein